MKKKAKCIFDPVFKPFLSKKMDFLPYFCSDMQNGSNIVVECIVHNLEYI